MDVRGSRKYEEVLEEGKGPRVQSSKGHKDQDISKSLSNTSLTLKKVHLVLTLMPKITVKEISTIFSFIKTG